MPVFLSTEYCFPFVLHLCFCFYNYFRWLELVIQRLVFLAVLVNLRPVSTGKYSVYWFHMKISLQLLLNPLPTTNTFCSDYPCSISFHLPQKNICKLFFPQIFVISLNSYNIPSSLLLDTLITKDCQY